MRKFLVKSCELYTFRTRGSA